MREVEYRARPGSNISDDAAAAVGEFIEEKFDGEIVAAEDVVEAAAPAESPIHTYFTWDDSEAATQYRLEQARRLMRAIMVVEHVGDTEVVTRAYHVVERITDEGIERGYVQERVVWQRPEYAEQVIERAKHEFLSWRARHKQYLGLLDSWTMEQIRG